MKLNKIISAFSAILIAAGSISLSRNLTYAESDNYSLTSSVYADEAESSPTTTTTAATTTTSAAGTSTTTTAKSTTSTKASAATTTTSAATTSKSTTSTTTSAASTTSTTAVTTKTPVYPQSVFVLSETEIAEVKAQKDGTVKVTVSVMGAEGHYCNTGIYLYYDERLTIDKTKQPVPGEAISKLSHAYAYGDTDDFVFLTTAGDDDYGKDGVMWTIYFKLPEDVKQGDEYHFRIGDSKYGKLPPTFIDYEESENGRKMQENIFSAKIPDGRIVIVENPSIEIPEDYTLGDVNGDGLINSVDASAVLTEYAYSMTESGGKFNELQKKAGDVNKDDILNSVDASLILEYYAYVSADGKLTFEEYLA